MRGGPVVTLLTDFGTADSYVAEMKGVLLTHAPDAILVDITHEIPPGDVLAGQQVLDRAWRRFPAGSIHLAVVDPGVGTSRRALALAARGHRFVGPDNGLFTPVLDGADVVALPIPGPAAPTFHGRDVFAPAAAALAGGTALQELGPPVPNPFRLPLPEPELRGGDVLGTVTYVDRFGTLVTNVPGPLVPAHAIIWVGDRAVGPVRRTFTDVPPHALVALIGSGGCLEVARRDGSAAGLLRAEVGSPVRVALAG